MRNARKFWFGKLTGKNHSEDQAVDGRIILKTDLRELGLEVWIGFIWFGIGTDRGLL
jgi:hypothetical protein